MEGQDDRCWMRWWEWREIIQVQDNNWKWMEVDGHEAADNDATEAGKDKNTRLMGERKETGARRGGDTNEYKRKYYSKNRKTAKQMRGSERCQARNEDRTLPGSDANKSDKVNYFFAPPHAVWLGYCHSSDQLTRHLLTDEPLLGYFSAILQKSIFKKNGKWLQGAWKGHCWVIPAAGGERRKARVTLFVFLPVELRITEEPLNLCLVKIIFGLLQ